MLYQRKPGWGEKRIDLLYSTYNAAFEKKKKKRKNKKRTKRNQFPAYVATMMRSEERGAGQVWGSLSNPMSFDG